jgi:ATP-dependent DNA helicase DinG
MNAASQIDKILGPDGLIAGSMKSYEHRSQQIEMAKHVYEALDKDKTLIIEAPTGTGKTLAYLLAAALTRKKVAISTGTKNLQEQLFFKDIPFVLKHVFPNLTAALLKGRGNFVCHVRLRRLMRQPYLPGLQRVTQLEDIVEWYKNTEEGDRAEIENLTDDSPIWGEICSTTDTCVGKKCKDREDCFVFRMRARASEADLMIVNHHLLVSDLSVKESGFGQVIPRYEALIVDEAHGFEDAVTQHFGHTIHQGQFVRLIRDARTELESAKSAGAKFTTVLDQIDNRSKRLFAAFDRVGGMRVSLGELPPEVTEAAQALDADCDALAAMIANIKNAPEDLTAIATRAQTLSFDLSTILLTDDSHEYARWSERRDKRLFLHASPIEIGDLLKNHLYDKIPAITFTSATLSSDNNCAYFRQRLGLDADAAEVILDSPFSFQNQTMLFVPPDLPEPNNPGYIDAVIPIIEDILERTDGRAFVLFTSYRNMEIAYSKLSRRLPFPSLMQGQKPRSRLLEEFQDNYGAVLFATSSFWEGVDVQGEALSCVIIDRLPFAPPNDPLVEARINKLKDNGVDAFNAFQVPMAIIALKQGLGRLIRTRNDRGVMCILDTRIIKKGYGKIFRRSLHQCPWTHEIDDVREFFRCSSQDK